MWCVYLVSLGGKDAIWVLIDRLAKVAHLVPMKTMSVPKSIVSDQDYKFVSKFWRSLHSVLGITLDLSPDFHP